MSIQIKTASYQASHGRKPTGYGWWIFEIRYTGPQGPVTEPFDVTATYSDAIKAAKRALRERNIKIADIVVGA